VLTVGDTGPGEDEGQTQGVFSVFGSVFGRIGQFLNLTTWYLMKDRSGKVGANGCAEAVRAVRAAAPAIKVHLVGHSLGGRLMASCAKTLAEEGTHKVDSLALLQAAFSHFGLSTSRKDNRPGFFRAVIDKKVVRGPLIATYSAKDTVVGKAYAIMSRLANDNVRAIGDENDEFGGIGRNGAQNAQNSIVEPLHEAGTKYSFSPDTIINLDGSKELIMSHGDVRNANVTYAFASAVNRT
jgi:pimeloyl-ACP methyl ester carboxylesterase